MPEASSWFLPALGRSRDAGGGVEFFSDGAPPPAVALGPV